VVRVGTPVVTPQFVLLALFRTAQQLIIKPAVTQSFRLFKGTAIPIASGQTATTLLVITFKPDMKNQSAIRE
jgi:hypothetical protein